MATTRAALRKKITKLLDAFEPVLKAAFLASVSDIVSSATLKTLTEAIAAGNLGAALDALDIERAAFAPLEQAIARTYEAGGTLMANNMPTLRGMNGAKIVVRFDSRNMRAEQILSGISTKAVTRLLDDQREAVQRALQIGLSRGQNPNQTALDIIGRVNPKTKRREGGLLGLSRPQVEYVATAKDELLSGDKALMRNYLTRNRRDRSFDREIRRAIVAGKPVSRVTVDAAVARYADRLLQTRGQAIARTETLTAIHSAKHEAFAQGLAKTNYPPEAVTRTWRSASDTKVRHTHAAMDGQQVVGLETAFISPSGQMLRFPGDTSLGAGAEEVINCRCDDDFEIDFSFGVS